MKPKVDEQEEALILEALAWKHKLDTGNDYAHLHKLRRRLRASDVYDLLWEYDQANL